MPTICIHTFLPLAICIALWMSVQVTAETPATNVVERMVGHVHEHADGKAAFSFDLSAYQQPTINLPIGVFDSGIGGLTVLEAILSLDAFNNDNLRPDADGRRDFEHERFIYLGDQANMPYGNYATHGQENYLRELILKDTVFLLGRRYWDTPAAMEPRWDKPPVKAIVIACNTATAYGLDDVRQVVKRWGIPVFVVGVVESGARGANELIRSSEPPKTIAIMATMGTCASMAYPKAISLACGLAGKRAPVVIQQGSATLAGAIEGDLSFLKTNDRSQADAIADCIDADVANLVESYRTSGANQPIEMVVLGCTHFPLVQGEIVEAFARLRSLRSGDDDRPYEDLIAESIDVVNPAELVAKELFRELARNRLRATGDRMTNQTDLAFYISAVSPNVKASVRTSTGELTSEYKYARQPGRLDLEDTRIVPMTVSELPDASRNLIRTRLPNVWARLSSSEKDLR